MADDQTLILEIRGGVGIATLNRPHRINALNMGLISQLQGALTQWRSNDEIELVILRGAGTRGFCAGGDLRGDSSEEPAEDNAFLRAEYALDHDVSTYPKPIVALMDGIVMGGGFGLAGQASHRIVTERSRLAMPETKIGLTPDAGMSFHLARVPHGWGMHWALTSATMDAAAALYCGLADHYVTSARLDDLVEALVQRDGRDVSEVIDQFSSPSPASSLSGASRWAARCYSADTVEEVLKRLDDTPSDMAASAAEKIRAASPFAVKTTFAALRSAAELELWDCLRQEFRCMVALGARADTREGITAVLIEKRLPLWQPPRLSDVADEDCHATLNFPIELGVDSLSDLSLNR